MFIDKTKVIDERRTMQVTLDTRLDVNKPFREFDIQA